MKSKHLKSRHQQLFSSMLIWPLVLAVLFSVVTAQDAKLPAGIKSECGTVLTKQQIDLERARQAVGYANLVPLANRPYRLPLTIHIVRYSGGTGGLTTSALQVAMRDLNAIWQQVGMQFHQRGAIDYIDNDGFMYISTQEERDQLRGVNPVANTINVYFTAELADLCGQSTFTGDAIQGILINNDCVGTADSPSTLAHEVGHYFDLYHTHETAFGVECPSGQNCSTAGDLMCSTAADPQLDYHNDVSAACVWLGSASNPNGCAAGTYDPPTQNIMSYSRRTCRTQFTSAQESKAISVLISSSNRVSLVNAYSRFVAPDGSTISSCSFASPCRTLTRAVQLASPNDSIFLLSGNYNETPAVNKRLNIFKWNTDAGNVIVGQP